MTAKQKLTIFSFICLALFACSGGLDPWLSSSSMFPDHPDAFLKGPYLQNPTQNSITIMWESKKPLIGKVFWGKENAAKNAIKESTASKIHEVKLSGLEPETSYRYKVQSGDRASGVYTFHTAVKKETPFSVVVYGDNKNGPFNHLKIVGLIQKKNPNFVIHVGDLVERGKIYKQYDKLFFNPARELMRVIPMFTLLGNHEDHAQLFADFFSLPNNEQWYSFDYGNAHFVILDDSDVDLFVENHEQLQWLQSDLRANKAQWTFVLFHIPPFTSGGGYYEDERMKIKNILHPIFEKYGVDIVFSGDDHDYERTLPIVSRSGKKPVTYIVCGNGGTPMRYVGSREWTAFSKRVFGFVDMKIDGPKLQLQSITIDGEVIDELTLDKSDAQSMQNYRRQQIYFEDIHDPLKAARLYSKGKKNLKRDDYLVAMNYFRQAIAADSTCAEALAGMAACYYEGGKLDSARLNALRAIDILPVYPQSYEVLANVAQKEKKIKKALEWCDRWLEVAPDSPEPNAERADIFEDLHQYEKAMDELKKALEILPNDPDFWFDLGKLYEKTGAKASAVFASQRGLYWFMDAEEDDDVIEAKNRLAELQKQETH